MIAHHPRGILISATLDLPPGPLGDLLRPVLAAIDRVHSDGSLPPLAVVPEPSLTDESDDVYADPPGIPLWIALRPVGTLIRINLLHEIGHFLDHQGFGTPGTFASSADPRFTRWRATVLNSEAVRILVEIRRLSRRPSVRGSAEYHLRTRELWARCYAQFIAVASGERVLLDELRERRSTTRGRLSQSLQWDDNDFAPIADTLAEPFRLLGWTT